MTFGFLRSLLIYHNPVSLLRWRRFYRGVLREGDLAFDIGAHVGNRSRAMRSAGAHVVAVEPQDPFSAFLKRALPRGVTVVDVAVGEQVGEMVLAISQRHPTVSTLSKEFIDAGKTAVGFEHVRWDRSQKVDVVTLDTLIARFGRPHYVKIDVEGAEAAILSGLSEPIPLISVEYLPAMPKLAVALVDQLAAMGNDRFNVVQGETAEFLWQDWRDDEAVKTWLRDQPPDAQSGDLFAARAESP